MLWLTCRVVMRILQMLTNYVHCWVATMLPFRKRFDPTHVNSWVIGVFLECSVVSTIVQPSWEMKTAAKSIQKRHICHRVCQGISRVSRVPRAYRGWLDELRKVIIWYYMVNIKHIKHQVLESFWADHLNPFPAETPTLWSFWPPQKRCQPGMCNLRIWFVPPTWSKTSWMNWNPIGSPGQSGFSRTFQGPRFGLGWALACDPKFGWPSRASRNSINSFWRLVKANDSSIHGVFIDLVLFGIPSWKLLLWKIPMSLGWNLTWL